MATDRRLPCCPVHRPEPGEAGDERCTCSELTDENGEPARQLASAWLCLGLGWFLLYAAYAVFAFDSSAGFAVGAIGIALVARGARMVSQTRTRLLASSPRAALPPARVVR